MGGAPFGAPPICVFPPRLLKKDKNARPILAETVRLENAYLEAMEEAAVADVLGVYEKENSGDVNTFSKKSLKTDADAGESTTQFLLSKIEKDNSILSDNAKSVILMNPVAELSGNEFEYDGKSTLQDKVVKFFKSFGNAVINEDLGEVSVTTNSFRDDKAHGLTRNKIVSFAAIPYVLKSGKIIEVFEKDKFQRIIVAARIKIKKAPYFMGAMIQRDNQSQRLYLHDVITEEATLSFTNVANRRNSEGIRDNGNLFITSILQKLLSVNTSIGNSNKYSDAEYLKLAKDPVKNKERLREMVLAAAKANGYDPNSDYQGSLAFNGSAPERNGYFETKDERKEAWSSGNYEGTMSLGDYADSGIDTNDLEWILENPIPASGRDEKTLSSIRNINAVLRSGKKKIKMFRAVRGDITENSFRNGDWITPSREYASYHIGLQDWESGRIISQEVSIDDVWWNGDDINEWGYDDGKTYAYRNTKNNRKSLETITYDDNGNIIPLSERFNEKKADTRWSLTSDLQNLTPAQIRDRAGNDNRIVRHGTVFVGTVLFCDERLNFFRPSCNSGVNVVKYYYI